MMLLFVLVRKCTYIGDISASLHSEVYEQYQSELIPGTVLLLSKVVL